MRQTNVCRGVHPNVGQIFISRKKHVMVVLMNVIVHISWLRRMQALKSWKSCFSVWVQAQKSRGFCLILPCFSSICSFLCFSCKKVEKAYFHQFLKCSAPKTCSKYTTCVCSKYDMFCRGYLSLMRASAKTDLVVKFPQKSSENGSELWRSQKVMLSSNPDVHAQN